MSSATAQTTQTAQATQAAQASATAAAIGAISTDEKLVAQYAAGLSSTPSVDFTLQDLNGKQWKLSDLKGKIVLLNFWATWCGPCQMEMPDFQKLQERFGADGGVVVLAVASTATENASEQESRSTVQAFIKQQGFTFPVLFDADGSVWQTYQQEGIPANYIIDRNGAVRLLITGAFQSEDHLFAALEAVRSADAK